MLEPVEMQPGPLYRSWFREVELCSGRSGSFDRIRWSVREEGQPSPGGRLKVGHIDFPDEIWIARPWVDVEGVVKHEELHYLLQREGHPTPPFGVCTGGY